MKREEIGGCCYDDFWAVPPHSNSSLSESTKAMEEIRERREEAVVTKIFGLFLLSPILPTSLNQLL